ncbi:hypothetical protein ACFCWD_32830 [Streptomyces sp. NPDC056374]|uniref:hypothetical protein n=1 Tax=unclassified Streptomyces TaxID=2593676 RepID=UPI0035E182CC
MLDPITTGVTADGLLRAGAGIAGSTISGAMQRPKITLIKLGSRDERREAYTNYLIACIALNHVLTLGAAGKEPWNEKDPAGITGELKVLLDTYKHPSFVAECALAEMELVATNPVLKAAHVVRDVLGNCVMNESVNHIAKATRQRSPEYQLAIDAFAEACAAYVAVCRKDLWYTPRWWQLHRQLGRLAGWAWKKAVGHGSLPLEMEKALDSGALQKVDAWGKLGKKSDGRPHPSGTIPRQSRKRKKQVRQASADHPKKS